MSNEDIYDNEIAPELARLAKRCQDLGMSFLASVEYDPEGGGRGSTRVMQKDTIGTLSCAQRLVHWADRANGNVDSLIIALMRHGNEHGHSSMCLHQLGCKNIKYTGNESAALIVTTES